MCVPIFGHPARLRVLPINWNLSPLPCPTPSSLFPEKISGSWPPFTPANTATHTASPGINSLASFVLFIAKPPTLRNLSLNSVHNFLTNIRSRIRSASRAKSSPISSMAASLALSRFSLTTLGATSSKQQRSKTPVRASDREEHTSELQSHLNLVCRLLLEKKKNNQHPHYTDYHSHKDHT